MTTKSSKYRGGSGNSGSDKYSSSKFTPIKKKNLSDYNYYLGTSKQASDYGKTTEYLINHIKKTYDHGKDIATALKNLEEFDLTPLAPTLGTSTKTDAALRATEEKQFEIDYNKKSERFIIREEQYEKNKDKAYAFLWERCTMSMQNKIQMLSTFEADIEDNPIKLLEQIKIHAMSFQEDRYPMEIIVDSLFSMLHTKQKDKEHLSDYTKRFKVSKDVMKAHIGGPIILTNYIKTLASYDALAPETAGKEGFEQLMSYLYLKNSDQAKYGSVLRSLKAQQSLENDQYPKTIAKASHVLSQHRADNAGRNNFNRTNRNNNKEKEKEEEDDSKPDEVLSLSFAQLEGACYCCGKKGHRSPECRHKDRPKSEWAINKLNKNNNQMSHVQEQQQDSFSDDDADDQETTGEDDEINELFSNMQLQNITSGWQGVHAKVHAFKQFFIQDDIRSWILLDSESSTSIFVTMTMSTMFVQ